MRNDERQAFLAAIVASPDDDLPRLIYSDWLSERGQEERAEFIRVGCELAKWKPIPRGVGCWGALDPPGTVRCSHDTCKCCDNDDVARRLRRRERALLTQQTGWGWPGVEELLPLPVTEPPPDTGGPWVAFRRGFVSRIAVPWGHWRANAEAILASCPIRRVNRRIECKYCIGRGRSMAAEGRQPCPTCQGTGKLDDWRGDGLVVLSDIPPPGSSAGWRWHANLVVEMDEWPGVMFKLPEAVGNGITEDTAAVQAAPDLRLSGVYAVGGSHVGIRVP